MIYTTVRLSLVIFVAAALLAYTNANRVRSKHIYGDTAVSNSRYLQKATYKGEALSGAFYLTDVWVKRDDRWQAVTRHSSFAESP